MSSMHWESGADGALRIDGTTWSLRASLPGPGEVSSNTDGHRRATERDGVVGGVAGRVTSCVTPDQNGWVVQREVFAAGDGSFVAVRMLVTNASPATRILDDFPLLRLGAGSLHGAGGGPHGWRIVRMSRQKNDVPGNYRPGGNDTDFEHAKIDGAELKAGRGVSAADLASLRADPNTVQADPMLWIKSRHDDAAPGLLLGVMGQSEHLSYLAVVSDAATGGLGEVCAVCEFDRVEVPAGATRQTHWLVIYEGTDEEAMRRRYAEMFAREFGVAQPGPALSMFCSWYFYGTDFTQDDLDENLAELRRRPIPFDTLLIDNGWMDDFGSYLANKRFPLGMAHAAERIAEAGYKPGIWTCPFVVSHDSKILKKYPNLLARDCDGQLMSFPYDKTIERVVDPTSPDAEPYLAELFTRLRGWGYTVHKLDFLRSIIVSPRIRFHDRTVNRAQAYRRGLELIRKHAGEGAYILACGGLFEASAGLADAVRIGSDTRGHWSDPNATNAYLRLGYLARIKQNLFRSHTNRLWHTDPDALQLRRRTEPFRDRTEFDHLSEGSFTDDEAVTLIANHYVGGGMVTLCERMAELPDDRYRLLRRVLPPVTPPARVLDFKAPLCPTLLLTHVQPVTLGLDDWHTLTVFNWADEPVRRSIPLAGLSGLAGKASFAVMELVTQKVEGPLGLGDHLHATIPAHGCRVFRIAPLPEGAAEAVLLGTDGHLSGGAAEFERFDLGNAQCRGRLTPAWAVPLRVTVGRLIDGELQLAALSLGDQGDFCVPFKLSRPKHARSLALVK